MSNSATGSPNEFSSSFFKTFNVQQIGQGNFVRDFSELLLVNQQVGPLFFEGLENFAQYDNKEFLSRTASKLVKQSELDRTSVVRALSIARFLVRVFHRRPKMRTDVGEFAKDICMLSLKVKTDVQEVRTVLEGLVKIAERNSSLLRRGEAVNGPVPVFSKIETSAEIRAIPETPFDPTTEELQNLTLMDRTNLVDGVPLVSIKITDNFGGEAIFQTGETGLRTMIVHLMNGLKQIEVLKSVKVESGINNKNEQSEQNQKDL